MRSRPVKYYLILVCVVSGLIVSAAAQAAEPIVIGVPTSLGFLEGHAKS